MLGAKAHGQREVACIGAAADGEGLFALARHLVVGVDQGFNGGVIRLNVERLLAEHIAQLEAAAEGSGKALLQLLLIHGSGIADIHALGKNTVLKAHHAAHQRERGKAAVAGCHANGAAVGAGVQLVHCLQAGQLGTLKQAALQQAVGHHANGVAGACRQAGVAADALSAHPCAVRPIGFQRDMLHSRESADGSSHQCGGTVRHGIFSHAALKLQQLARKLFRVQHPLENALFTVAHRELCIRREAEHRHLAVFHKVFHIQHTGFLVGTHQHANGIAQCACLLTQVFECIQAQQHGALIVQHAAAQHPAILLAQGERVSIPAVTGGNHIQMSDHTQIFFRFLAGQLSPADITLFVVCGKAQLGADGQSLVQCGLGGSAEGCIGLGFALRAGDRHQASQIAQDIGFICADEVLNFLSFLSNHDFSPSVQADVFRLGECGALPARPGPAALFCTNRLIFTVYPIFFN